jgi:predicted ribosomally synthesized peptide with nif11-like leader
MSKRSLSEFLIRVNEDAPLREALESTQAEVVAKFAAEHGFEFSAEEYTELSRAMRKHRAGELTDEELAALSGGMTKAELIGGLAPAQRLRDFKSNRSR